MPRADAFFRAEETPRDFIQMLAERGYLGLWLPSDVGGQGQDMLTLGLLHAEIGRGCAAIRSLLTVHSMVAQTLARWGTDAQRERWLRDLASGRLLAAFALSEPEVGSDAGSVQTRATRDGDGFVLDGCKMWITYGQLADLFLVFARCDDRPTTFLVERRTPGLAIEPIRGMLGLRASMTARLTFNRCRIPIDSQIGPFGGGVALIGSYALDFGRFSVAWGSVGLAQACLDACILHTSERRQFGKLLKDHQLIRRMITDMMVRLESARLHCVQAAHLHDAGDIGAVAATSMAKYCASTAAMQSALDAVQIHGAHGCGPYTPVQRYLGDAKVGEIIEGSNEIQQITLAEYGYQRYRELSKRSTWRAETHAGPALGTFAGDEPAQH